MDTTLLEMRKRLRELNEVREAARTHRLPNELQGLIAGMVNPESPLLVLPTSVVLDSNPVLGSEAGTVRNTDRNWKRYLTFPILKKNTGEDAFVLQCLQHVEFPPGWQEGGVCTKYHILNPDITTQVGESLVQRYY